MPESFENQITPDQMSDLLSFLATPSREIVLLSDLSEFVVAGSST